MFAHVLIKIYRLFIHLSNIITLNFNSEIYISDTVTKLFIKGSNIDSNPKRQALSDLASAAHRGWVVADLNAVVGAVDVPAKLLAVLALRLCERNGHGLH